VACPGAPWASTISDRLEYEVAGLDKKLLCKNDRVILILLHSGVKLTNCNLVRALPGSNRNE